MARALADHLTARGAEGSTGVSTANPPTSPPLNFSESGLHGLAHLSDATTAASAKTYLQNIGGFLSSREAEDHLVRLGLLTAPFAEESFPGDNAAASAEVGGGSDEPRGEPEPSSSSSEDAAAGSGCGGGFVDRVHRHPEPK